ncbi:MAG: 1-deoxy-D-xylulose-5-phosphate synthase N-terminal domain-containing protein, partial [Bacteroidales bacterium]
MSYLEHIQYPVDVRKLKVSELPALCEEIREFIINKTAENPGHLGASLGTIELTVALHYVFNTPYDKLVWDVGHQAYCHKIITGRKNLFHSNRKYGGISGFPKMSESEYDSFGTGHSSTSISAILGMAISSKLSGNDNRHHIAVIGDGAIGGGMAFEAMNQAGATNANMLIVLNDNKIAIDQNVGAMSKYLLHITSSATYNNLKNRLWNFFTLKKN